MQSLTILEALTSPKIMTNVVQAVSLPERTVSELSWKNLVGWRTGVLLVLIGWLYAPILARLVLHPFVLGRGDSAFGCG